MTTATSANITTGSRRRVVIFGGTFDPPHVGHVLASQWILSTADVDELWWVPVSAHAWDKAPLPFTKRLELCELAISSLPERVLVSAVEHHLPTPSYTINTLRHLSAEHPDTDFILAMGSDAAASRHRWHLWDEIERGWEILVMPRLTGPGTDEFALPRVSSTEVRSVLSSAEPQKSERLAQLLPRAVLHSIIANNYYAEEP